MSEELKLPPIYLMVKQIAPNDEHPTGAFQISIANEKQDVVGRMKDGFRAFKLCNEALSEEELL